MKIFQDYFDKFINCFADISENAELQKSLEEDEEIKADKTMKITVPTEKLKIGLLALKIGDMDEELVDEITRIMDHEKTGNIQFKSYTDAV